MIYSVYLEINQNRASNQLIIIVQTKKLFSPTKFVHFLKPNHSVLIHQHDLSICHIVLFIIWSVRFDIMYHIKRCSTNGRMSSYSTGI